MQTAIMAGFAIFERRISGVSLGGTRGIAEIVIDQQIAVRGYTEPISLLDCFVVEPGRIAGSAVEVPSRGREGGRKRQVNSIYSLCAIPVLILRGDVTHGGDYGLIAHSNESISGEIYDLRVAILVDCSLVDIDDGDADFLYSAAIGGSDGDCVGRFGSGDSVEAEG